MKKIKIAHITRGIKGGVSNVILNYFDHMPMEDYEVHILSNDISSQTYLQQFEARGFRVIEVPKSSLNILQRIKRWRELMQEQQYDIVHCHQTLTNPFPLYAAKKSGVAVRISHSHLVTNSHGSLKDRLLTFINHKYSKYLATDCMACGIAAGKSLFGEKNPFTVLNNALELDAYQFDPEIRAVEREKLHLQDAFVIGHVGRFTHQKNHKFLLDIFAALLQRCPEAKLLLIGEGELMDEMKAYAANLGVADRVIYTGAIQDVPRKLQAMDVFVLPSRAEGLGIVAIEAQAVGMPCVASQNVPKEAAIIPEIVSFVSLQSSVEKWCDEIIKYRGMHCENTLKRLQEKGYDITAEAEKLDAFYKHSVKK